VSRPTHACCLCLETCVAYVMRQDTAERTEVLEKPLRRKASNGLIVHQKAPQTSPQGFSLFIPLDRSCVLMCVLISGTQNGRPVVETAVLELTHLPAHPIVSQGSQEGVPDGSPLEIPGRVPA